MSHMSTGAIAAQTQRASRGTHRRATLLPPRLPTAHQAHKLGVLCAPIITIKGQLLPAVGGDAAASGNLLLLRAPERLPLADGRHCLGTTAGMCQRRNTVHAKAGATRGCHDSGRRHSHWRQPFRESGLVLLRRARHSAARDKAFRGGPLAARDKAFRGCPLAARDEAFRGGPLAARTSATRTCSIPLPRARFVRGTMRAPPTPIIPPLALTAAAALAPALASVLAPVLAAVLAAVLMVPPG